VPESCRVVDPQLRAELMARLNGDAAVIAAHFGLRYRVIEAESPRVKRRYGVCYRDGTIRIRLAHVVTGRPLRYSSLVATLCHELAHLRHFDHGARFRSFNLRILEWARQRSIYRPRTDRAPRPRAPAPPPHVAARPAPPPLAPRQLTLFG
jgi:predicted metal-dependent hydrolase